MPIRVQATYFMHPYLKWVNASKPSPFRAIAGGAIPANTQARSLGRSRDTATSCAPQPPSPTRGAHEHGDSKGRILPRTRAHGGTEAPQTRSHRSHQNAAPDGRRGGEGWVVSVPPRRSGLSSEDKRIGNPGQQPREHRGQEKHAQSRRRWLRQLPGTTAKRGRQKALCLDAGILRTQPVPDLGCQGPS